MSTGNGWGQRSRFSMTGERHTTVSFEMLLVSHAFGKSRSDPACRTSRSREFSMAACGARRSGIRRRAPGVSVLRHIGTVHGLSHRARFSKTTWRRRCRYLPDEARGWGGKRTVLASCKASPSSTGNALAELRILRVSFARGYAEIKAPIRSKACCRSGQRAAGPASRFGAGTRVSGCPGKLKNRGPRRSRAGWYIPILDLRRTSVSPWEAEAGHYYYPTEYVPRTGPFADGAGPARRGSLPPARPAFFDDEPVRGRMACRMRCSERFEPFHTAELVPYARGFFGVHRRAYQICAADAARPRKTR